MTSDPTNPVEPAPAPRTLALGVRTALAGATITLLCTGLFFCASRWNGEYGITIFMGIPFVIGLFAGIMNPWGDGIRRGLWQVLILTLCLVGGMAFWMLLFAWEGVLCIAMAVPIVIPLALLGALCGYAAQRTIPISRHRGTASLAVLVIAPMIMGGAERVAKLTPPVYAVTTVITVNAMPEAVWKNVVTFPRLPEPTELMFRAGIAYPVSAVIDGEGPGAIRRCEFNTGNFVEPIDVWDAPHLLSFSVTENPPPMLEWSPYGSIHPPHLDGFLVARKGEFRLTPGPNGSTQLAGTTWYSHGLWPATYWRLWSDAIIHQIHTRVLEHIKHITENE